MDYTLKKYRYGDWAEKHFRIGNRSGAEWMIACPIHGDNNPSLQLNVETGLWVCFVCHSGGRIERLSNEIGFPLRESEIDIADIMQAVNLLMNEPEDEGVKVWPESELTRFDFPCTYWTKDRGFDEKVVRAFQLGYDPIGDDFNGEFGTIPLRDVNGQLIGVIKRYLGDDVEKNERYRYSKGYKKAHHLFGAWLLQAHPTDTVVITEGALDAIRLWQAGIPAVAICGNAISLEQIRILRRLGIRQITLMFDNDKGGRDATDVARGWKKHIRKVEDRATGRTLKKEVSEYDERYDLRREFLCKKVIYRPFHESDPGAMSIMHIKRAVAKAKSLL